MNDMKSKLKGMTLLSLLSLGGCVSMEKAPPAPTLTLAEAVRNTPLPSGKVQAFVHGNAHMVTDLRRFLFIDRDIDKSQVSISGYWRTDYTEDAWQASKHEFIAAMEAEEMAAKERQ